MKKRIYIGLFALVLCVLLVGCDKEKAEREKKRTDGTFEIVCTKEEEKQKTHSVEYVNTYYFKEDQIAYKYNGIVTQIFKEKDDYNETKDLLQKTADGEKGEGQEYKLDADDEKLTLVFTVTLDGLDKYAKSDEEKANLKAAAVLKDNEEQNNKCEFRGISKNDIK